MFPCSTNWWPDNYIQLPHQPPCWCPQLQLGSCVQPLGLLWQDGQCKALATVGLGATKGTRGITRIREKMVEKMVEKSFQESQRWKKWWFCKNRGYDVTWLKKMWWSNKETCEVRLELPEKICPCIFLIVGNRTSGNRQSCGDISAKPLRTDHDDWNSMKLRITQLAKVETRNNPTENFYLLQIRVASIIWTKLMDHGSSWSSMSQLSWIC